MTEQQELQIKSQGYIPLEINGKLIALQPREESLKKLAEKYKLGVGTSKDNLYYLLGLEGNYIKCYYWISPDFSNYGVYLPGWEDRILTKMIRLDLSNFDTSEVCDMSKMFKDCKHLTSLDLSSFDTSGVTDMCEMFQGCEKLETLDLSNFDTSKVRNMRDMFANCQNLKSLDLSSFDTSKVTDINAMFFNCHQLETLDLSNFDTNDIDCGDHYLDFMFKWCRSLQTIIINRKKNYFITTDLRYHLHEVEFIEPTEKPEQGAASECNAFS